MVDFEVKRQGTIQTIEYYPFCCWRALVCCACFYVFFWRHKLFRVNLGTIWVKIFNYKSTRTTARVVETDPNMGQRGCKGSLFWGLPARGTTVTMKEKYFLTIRTFHTAHWLKIISKTKTCSASATWEITQFWFCNLLKLS